MASKEFEALSIPEWKLTLADASAKVYRVFKNESEFETIEAESATDAISKCGTQHVFMIRAGSLDSFDILQQNMLARIDITQPELVAEVTEQPVVNA